jgi:hypothetical protein
VAVALNNIFAPFLEMFYVNNFGFVLQSGWASTSRLMQMEAVAVGAGQGELAAAEANMSFLSSLVMPQLFTSLYTHCTDSWPAAPYWLTIAMHLFNAEVLNPIVYQRLGAATLKAAAPISVAGSPV